MDYNSKMYVSMFDGVWKVTKARFLDLLEEVESTGCIEDVGVYGKALAPSTSKRYLNDPCKSVFCVLDLTKEEAAFERKYLLGQI